MNQSIIALALCDIENAHSKLDRATISPQGCRQNGTAIAEAIARIRTAVATIEVQVAPSPEMRRTLEAIDQNIEEYERLGMNDCVAALQAARKGITGEVGE